MEHVSDIVFKTFSRKFDSGDGTRSLVIEPAVLVSLKQEAVYPFRR